MSEPTLVCQFCGADRTDRALRCPSCGTMVSGSVPSSALDLESAFARLRKWSRDEEHVVQSVRHWEPTYKNPAALVKARVKP